MSGLRQLPEIRMGGAAARHRHLFIASTVEYSVLTSLIRAWWIKIHPWSKRISLSPVADSQPQGPLELLPLLVARADRAVRLGAFWTGRKCFFRAFVLTDSLRLHGVPAVLNIGLGKPKHAQAARLVDGHCWTSIDGQAVAEAQPPDELYPILLGDNGRGVCYWSGDW